MSRKTRVYENYTGTDPENFFGRGASPLLPHPPSLSGEGGEPRKFYIFSQKIKARKKKT